RADPLAAGLDQILVTVLNAHRRPFVDGDDVAGSEPTIFGKTIAAVVALIVARSDPWASYLELAHRLAVPRDETVLVSGADFNEWRRTPLLGLLRVFGLGRSINHVGWRVRGCPKRSHFSHSPGVNNSKPMTLVECFDQCLRNCGAAYDHRVKRRQVVSAR